MRRKSVRATDATTAMDDLGRLLTQISGGSRDALRLLFDRTSEAMRDGLDAHLPDQRRATAVLVGTYVEIWWLARCRIDPAADATGWINQIMCRRLAEELAVVESLGHDAEWIAEAAESRSRCAALHLADLLGRPVETLTGRRRHACAVADRAAVVK